MRLQVADHSRRPTRGAGFTVIELAIATALVAVLGLALISATLMGNNAQVAVSEAVDASQGLRAASVAISGEFKSTDADTITVTALADGNHELSFMVPVVFEGTATWGVYDRSYGQTADEQNKVGWQIRYTVAEVEVNGVGERQLVRQVLDDLDVVQEQETILRGLREGGGASPGLRVTQAGEMWEIEINTVGYKGDSQGERADFHVRTRN
jgi:type II secretory pathway pseudopilin PulG